MTFEVTHHLKKNLHLHNVYNLKVLKRIGVKQKKYIWEKDDFEILRRSYVTFNDIWGQTLFNKNLRLNNGSIHRTFIKIGSSTNMLERKKLKSRSPGVTESRSPGVSESRSFLVRYRRTYVLKNTWKFRILRNIFKMAPLISYAFMICVMCR